MGQSSCAQLLMERTRKHEGSASEAISGEQTRRTFHALSSQCLLSSREGNTHLNIEKQLAHVTESDQEPRMILKGRLKEKYSEGRYQRKTGFFILITHRSTWSENPITWLMWQDWQIRIDRSGLTGLTGQDWQDWQYRIDKTDRTVLTGPGLVLVKFAFGSAKL